MPSAIPEPITPLFFLHIRKTAGCSVRNWLLNRFPVEACLLDTHHVTNGQIDPSHYQFVTGHVSFDYVERFSRRPVCFVVLRHPIERALSAFYFFQRNSAPYLQWLKDTLPHHEAEERIRFTRRSNELSLVDFLEAEPVVARNLLGNVQSRYMANRSQLSPGSDRELLDEAKRNLESCELVGLTERLEVSLYRVAEYMGWGRDRDAPPHDNPTAGRPRLGEISPRARDILSEWNQVDFELYRSAEQLFEAWKPPQRAERGELPACTDFTFGQAIHGRGWYAREKGERGWFCWLGREASLDLRPEGSGECVLEVRVAHVLNPALLEGLEVRVNGQRLATRARGDGTGHLVEASVPAALVASDPHRVRVTFTMRETVRPCDLVPGTPDSRALGVAIDRVRLIPALAARRAS